MKRALLFIVFHLCLVAPHLAGCGEDTAESQVFTYDLIPASSPTVADGSVISASCPGSATPPAPPESISGTFTLTAAQKQSGSTSNFTIAHIAFSSASFTVTGDSGGLSLSSDNLDRPLSMTLSVAINGDQATLVGSGSTATFSGTPPALHGVVLSGQGATVCGAGSTLQYTLTVFAVPQV